MRILIVLYYYNKMYLLIILAFLVDNELKVKKFDNVISLGV